MDLKGLYKFYSEYFDHIDDEFDNEINLSPYDYIGSEDRELWGIRLKVVHNDTLNVNVDTAIKTFRVYDTFGQNYLHGELSETTCDCINKYFCPPEFYVSTKHSMSLNEAIEHCDDVANRKCDSCGAEHKQLGEWLKELREYRNQGCRLSTNR